MSWQILTAISVIFYSVSVILQRKILKASDSRPIAFSLFFQFFVGIFVAALGFVFTNMTLPDLRPLFINLVLMTLFYTGANIFLFRAFKAAEASRVTIVFATHAFFTVVASTLFLKESLVGIQILGALLIFVGVFLVNFRSGKFIFDKGAIFALVGAVFFGFANTNDRFLLHAFNVFPYMSVGFLLPAVFLAVLYPKEAKNMKIYFKPSVFWKVSLFPILYGFSALTFFTALKIGSNSSQVVTANLTGIILTVLLAIIFLKERQNLPQKLLAALIAFIGLILIG